MEGWEYLKNEEMKKLMISCLQNASVCFNSIENFKESVVKCTKVIQMDETAVKAFYLRSVANCRLQNYDAAVADIKEAIKLSP